MIICAAVKVVMNNIAETTLIVPGYRHGDCYHVIAHLDSNWIHSKKTEGFLTHKNEFLDREQAFYHAVECGQLSQANAWYKEDHMENELYSEDLY